MLAVDVLQVGWVGGLYCCTAVRAARPAWLHPLNNTRFLFWWVIFSESPSLIETWVVALCWNPRPPVRRASTAAAALSLGPSLALSASTGVGPACQLVPYQHWASVSTCTLPALGQRVNLYPTSVGPACQLVHYRCWASASANGVTDGIVPACQLVPYGWWAGVSATNGIGPACQLVPYRCWAGVSATNGFVPACQLVPTFGQVGNK
jgi:hypothetical protein